MEVYPHLLLRLLLGSFLGGIALGAVYDTVRLSRVLFGVCHYSDIRRGRLVSSPFGRRLFPRFRRGTFFANAMVVLQDLCFCFAFFAMTAILLFYGNDGGFRGFVLLALGAGFLLYYATLGRLFIRVSEYVIFWLKTAVLYAVYYVTRPFVWIARVVKNTARQTYCHIHGKLLRRRIFRYDAKKRKELLRLSECGFIGLSWKEHGIDQTY